MNVIIGDDHKELVYKPSGQFNSRYTNVFQILSEQLPGTKGFKLFGERAEIVIVDELN